ncbi:lactonase family protein [candidate division KSB1 bacterium]|nr:lactonase family protein [candidate division KSB1 bacterium]
MLNAQNKKMLLFIGTYANADEDSIFIYQMDQLTGNLELSASIKGVENPSYLAVSPDHQFLYAVNEVSGFQGQAWGTVSALAINLKTRSLKFLNKTSSQGAHPCYITVDNQGRFVLVANYTGGNVAVLPVENDGQLGDATSVMQHQGSSINPQRQAGPHAHSIILTSDNRLALAADLGIDKIMIYRFDSKNGKLTPNSPDFAPAKPGVGPRHLAIHPNNQFLYAINELNSTITGYSFSLDSGKLQTLQTVSTLPTDYKLVNSGADIHISPDGKFLYGSNRGHDSIAIFKIDQNSGKLESIGHEPTQGKKPRNFVIDPTGKFLLVANQDSNNVVVFRREENTGKLKATGTTIQVSRPVCLKIISENGE